MLIPMSVFDKNIINYTYIIIIILLKICLDQFKKKLISSANIYSYFKSVILIFKWYCKSISYQNTRHQTLQHLRKQTKY